MSRIYTITRLSSAGELPGLDMAAPRDFKLMPYVLGSTNRNFASSSQTEYDWGGDWGIDGKVGVTSSTTLDLTYNTDFAQVEVDEQQINLTRFNLLFPEKRPFFLENRGLFAVGRPGEIDLFFSRAIGISDTGTLLPIQGGARLTGKARGVNIGVLNMQTEEVGPSTANNFTAMRVNKDLANRSSLGAMFVNRKGTSDSVGPDDYNRTYSVDGKLGLREAVTISGFGAKTETPGLSGEDYAYSSAFEFRTRTYETSVSYAEVGDNFNPEVGFLERPDGYRQVTTALRRHIRNPTLAKIGLREFEPHMSYESYWGFDGLQETATLHLDGRWDFESGYTIGSAALNVQWEGLREPFEVYPGVVVPPGNYTKSVLPQQCQHRSAQVDLGQPGRQRGRLPVGQPAGPLADAEHPTGRPAHLVAPLEPQRHRPAGGCVRDESGEREDDLQLLDPHQRLGFDSVQRSDAALVHEPQVQLAGHGGDRSLRRVQRHRSIRGPGAGEPHVHRQVLAHDRHPELKASRRNRPAAHHPSPHIRRRQPWSVPRWRWCRFK